MSDNISRTAKGIVNTTILSKTTMVSKIYVATM
jgi:hypothetical protein